MKHRYNYMNLQIIILGLSALIITVVPRPVYAATYSRPLQGVTDMANVVLGVGMAVALLGFVLLGIYIFVAVTKK